MVGLNCDRMPQLEGCLVCLILLFCCINWTLWPERGWTGPRWHSITDTEPRAPGFHSGALSFPVDHLLLLNHPLPCVTRQSLGHTFLSMYWLGTSCGIFSCGTGAFKNPILPRVSTGQQHQGHGHVVVASSHLPGSVQHFGQRELGLPGQASC